MELLCGRRRDESILLRTVYVAELLFLIAWMGDGAIRPSILGQVNTFYMWYMHTTLRSIHQDTTTRWNIYCDYQIVIIAPNVVPASVRYHNHSHA